MSILSATDLQEIVSQVESDEQLPLLEIAEGWLHWFKKRGDRYLKDAAKLGYSEVTLDLPIEIGRSMDIKALVLIQKTLKVLLEGCIVAFAEDEYKDKPICRLLIRW